MESESEEVDFKILHQILNDYDDDSDEDDEKVVPPKKNCSAIDVQLRKINKLKSDQNLSNVTTVKIAKLINSASGVNVKIPQTKKYIQKSAADQSEIEKPIIFVFCERCERIVLNNQMCSSCKIVAKKNSK